VGCLNPAECTKCNLKCPVALVYTGCSPATCAAIPDKVCAEGTRTGQASKTCDTTAGKKCQAGSAPTCNTTSDPPNTFTPAGSPACSTVITGVNKTNTVLPAATIGKSYEQDANANGDVCRRNNFSGYSSGGWTYPSGAFTTAVTSGCGTITASINRHYYKSTVQWCDTQIATSGNDKWRGFGKGACQAEKTAVYKFPRFFKPGAYADSAFATEQDNYGDNTAFQLVELDYKNEKIIVANGTPASSIDHTFVRDGETVTVSRDVGSATPAASELVNYANWFAYYRTRILAAKTVTSLAFSELTDKFRVGFHTLANPASSFLTIKEFTGGGTGHRKDWFAKLAAVSIPMGNDTPLIDGVVRIGEWFKATDGKSAALSGSTDPIALSCQKNFHMMFTDGYTNQAKPSSTMTNQDTGKIGKLPSSSSRCPRPRTGRNATPRIPRPPSTTRWPTTRCTTGGTTCAPRPRSPRTSPTTTCRRATPIRPPGSTSTSRRCRSAPKARSRRATSTRPRRPSRVAASCGRRPRRPIVRDPRAWTTCGMPRSTGTACS
jgi:hypothetical protein